MRATHGLKTPATKNGPESGVMRETLEQLLRTTDAANPPPDRLNDLATAVNNRRVRRRRVRVASATATAVLAVVLATVLMMHKTPSRVPAPFAVVPAARPAEMSIQAQARLHELTIERLEHRRERRKASASVAAVAFAPSPGELRDRAALILIYDADQHLQSHRRDDAVAMYRRTIELFPQSHWATIARQRLKQLEA